MKIDDKNKNITRIDHKNTHGWQVRINHAKRAHSKFFADKKYGGRYSALLSAVSWRKDKLQQLGKPDSKLHSVGIANNNTGVVGVRFDEKKEAFQVSWYDKFGKPGNTKISVKLHGWEKAFEIACSIREQKETERHCGV